MIVVDASALVSYLVGGSHSGWARERLAEGGRQGGLCAPHLIDAEVGQALRRIVRTGELSSRSAAAALVDLADLPIRRVSHAALLDEAWSMRANLTFYDALYVALAYQMGASLLTLDQRIGRAPGVKVPVWSPAEGLSPPTRG